MWIQRKKKKEKKSKINENIERDEYKIKEKKWYFSINKLIL